MVYEAVQVGETDKGEFYQVNAPLDKAVRALSAVGIPAPFLATPSQMTDFRLTHPDKANQSSTRTSCAPVKVRSKPTIITANSPWLLDEATAKVAVEAHRRGEYPTLHTGFYDALEEIAQRQSSLEPEDRTVHILGGKPDSDSIITLVPDSDDARFLIKRLASNYFTQFNHPTILLYDLSDENIPKGVATVNYLWFFSPDFGSYFDAWYGALYDGDRSSGVLPKTAKGGS